MDEILGYDSRKAPTYAMAAASDYIANVASSKGTIELEAPADRAVYIVEANVSQGVDVFAVAPEDSTHITASLTTVAIGANFGGFDATATFRSGVSTTSTDGDAFLLDLSTTGNRFFYPQGLYIPPGKIFGAKTNNVNQALSAGLRWLEFPV